MTKNLDEIGLKSIANNYDLFFIDIWGVIHNGIEIYTVLDFIQRMDPTKTTLAAAFPTFPSASPKLVSTSVL